mmetsp:Transcript_97185/g.313387  ORF Transcript_97185/g.313387 Transcript_97185/m.313387 type:complete len:212 (-) Transcript_97185:128-763(-)
MVGLACSSTRPKRESMVLSMLILPTWQARTTPPKQEGPCWPSGAVGSFTDLSRLSLQAFVAPVSALTILAYSAAAAARHFSTTASSQARQRTCTSSSKSINKPCTMSCVMNWPRAFWSFSCVWSTPLASLLISPMTSCLAVIFSSLDLLMAVERAMAFWVSTCFDLRSYSWRIFSLVELTTFNFSTLNSCKAFALISSALSLASFRMNWVI